LEVTIPSSTVVGAYYLLACADDMKMVAERNETNNCIASTSKVQVGGPDLIETFVTNPPPAVLAGKSFKVTDTVKNQGDADAGSSTTRYYLSGDALKGTEDILLTGSRFMPGLAPRATSTGQVEVTTPSSTAEGVYHLLACADDTQVVPEINDTNNCIASGTTVQVIPSP
jgi:subtilase family serine protease